MFLTGIIITKVYEVQGYSPGILGGKKEKEKKTPIPLHMGRRAELIGDLG